MTARPNRSGAFVRWAVGVGLVLALAQFADTSRLRASLSLDLVLASFAILPIVVLGWVFAGWRHALLIEIARPPVLVATRAYVASVGVNVLLPFRIGEVVKATYLREHCGTPLRAGLSAIVIERLLDFILIASIGAVGLWTSIGRDALVPVLLGLGGAVVALAAARTVRRGRLRLAARRFPRALAFAFVFADTLLKVARSATFPAAIALTLLAWSTHFVAFLVFFALSPAMAMPGLSVLATTYAGTLLAGAIPGLPGGLGAYQAAGTFILTKFGYPFEPALVSLIVVQLAFLAPAVIFAIFEFGGRSTGIRSLLAGPEGLKRAKLFEPTPDNHPSGQGEAR